MNILLQFLNFDLDQAQIINTVSHKLGCNCQVVPTQVDLTNLHRQFGFAGISLENFLYSDKTFWSKDKSYSTALWIWDQNILSNTQNLDFLKDFETVINPNLVVFSNCLNHTYSPGWIYGNVIALTKLAAVILKADRSMLKKFELEWDVNQYSILMWAADRIGLDVYAINL